MANIDPQDYLILNVDDSDPARYAKSRILKHAGFSVEEAANGTDALRKANELQPDLILLDTKLPDINGFEVCRRLKADAQTRPILVLQTSASYIKTSDKIDALDSGADNYLFEPLEPDELVANVKALIRLSKAEHELRLANRRKDEFLATLAHELRNPLGPIRNAVSILQRLDPVVPPQQENARQVILRQTRHMVRLIDDLLDVSRISLGKINLAKEPVELKTILDNAIETAGDVIAARQHAFEVTRLDQEIWFDGDPVRLAQIITNLLNNAAKFTPIGGRIGLTVTREGDQAVLTVRDSGIGLEADSATKIFELFTQDRHSEDRVQDGLGIGLSLVKQLTELHGGRVTAYSDGLGQGSRFEVRLPISTAFATATDIPSPSMSAVTVAPHLLTILIVDDNRDSADSLSDWFALSGHQVTTAYTGSDGIKRAESLQPQVVFLDIGLPDCDGYEVARSIRHLLPASTQLIALTGYGTDADKVKAREAGFDSHLVKPLDLKKLDQLGIYSVAS